MRSKAVLAIGLLVLLPVAVTVFAETGGTTIDAEKIKFSFKDNVTVFWGTALKPVSIEMDKYKITAAYLEYYQKEERVVASGGVNLVGADPEVRLTAEQIEARRDLILASGSVTFAYDQFAGSAEKLTYWPEEERLLLEGNPLVTTDGGELKGQHIEVDLADGTMVASGGSSLRLDEVGGSR